MAISQPPSELESAAMHSVASVAGLRAAFRAADADELGRQVASGDVLPLPRNTQSAVSAVKHARGLEAAFARFPIRKQQAIRNICIERLDLKERLEPALARFREAVQEFGGYADDKPDVLRRLEDRLEENHETLVRLLDGDVMGTRVIEASLDDEGYRSHFALPVASEDVAREHGGGLLAAASFSSARVTAHEPASERGEHMARIWRRKLDTGKPSRKVLGVYGRPTHTHPNKHGDKTIWDELDTAQAEGDERHLSYYQRQQRKYGRARRGSTAVAGAWEEVFGAKAHQERVQAAQEQPAAAAAAAVVAAGHRLTTGESWGAGGGSGNGGGSGSHVGDPGAAGHSHTLTAQATGLSLDEHHHTDGEEVSYAGARAATQAAVRMQHPEMAPRATRGRGEAAVDAAAASSGDGDEENEQASIAQAAREAVRRAGQRSSPHASAAAAAAVSSRNGGSHASTAHDEDDDPFATALELLSATQQAAAAVSSPHSQPRRAHTTDPMPPHHHHRAPPPHTAVATAHHHQQQQQASQGRLTARQSSSSSLLRPPAMAAVAGSMSGRSMGARSAATATARPPVESIAGFTTRDLEGVMPALRHTPSAIVAASRGQPKDSVRAVFAGLTLKAQRAGKLIVSELAELLTRYEAGFDRLQATLGREPTDEELPEFMLQIDTVIARKQDELLRAVGPRAADRLFALAQDEDARRAMGLEAETEEMQEDEGSARLWRRQVSRFKSFRFEESNKPKRVELRGADRDIFGLAAEAAKREGENVSYYERQQRKYGRGRRGSTSHAGAWDSIFAEEEAASKQQPQQQQQQQQRPGLHARDSSETTVRVVHSASDLWA